MHTACLDEEHHDMSAEDKARLDAFLDEVETDETVPAFTWDAEGREVPFGPPR